MATREELFQQWFNANASPTWVKQERVGLMASYSPAQQAAMASATAALNAGGNGDWFEQQKQALKTGNRKSAQKNLAIFATAAVGGVAASQFIAPAAAASSSGAATGVTTGSTGIGMTAAAGMPAYSGQIAAATSVSAGSAVTAGTTAAAATGTLGAKLGGAAGSVAASVLGRAYDEVEDAAVSAVKNVLFGSQTPAVTGASGGGNSHYDPSFFLSDSGSGESGGFGGFFSGAGAGGGVGFDYSALIKYLAIFAGIVGAFLIFRR